MKISKIILFLILIFSFAPSTFAVKRAPFPNSNPLQPIPHNVLPNITSNVNSDTVQPEQLPDEPAIQVVVATNTDQHAASSGSGGALVVYTIIGIALIAGIYLRFRAKK